MPQRSGSLLASLPRAIDLELTVYVDGSCVPNPGPSGFGMLVLARTHTQDEVFGYVRNIGFGGNNAAEFMALAEATELIRSAKPRRALIVSDSVVALRLITGVTSAQTREHAALQRRATAWLAQNHQVELCWVERKRNLAHHLARTAAELPAGTQQVAHLGTQSRRAALAA